MSYKEKSFGDRMNAAAEARKATLQRVLSRPGANDPTVIAQKAERAAIATAREARVAARNEAKRVAEKAAQDAIRAAALAAEQKAARDARYAARKARK